MRRNPYPFSRHTWRLAVVTLLVCGAFCATGCQQAPAVTPGPAGGAATVHDAEPGHFGEHAGGAPPAEPEDDRQRQARELRHRGDQAMSSGQFDTADASYRLALQLDSRQTHAAVGLGRINAQRGQLQDAVSWLRRAVEGGMIEFDRLGRDPLLSPLQGFGPFNALLAEREVWLERMAARRVDALKSQLGEQYRCHVDRQHRLIIATGQNDDFLQGVIRKLSQYAAAQWTHMFRYRPEAWITVVLPTRADFRRFVPDPRIGGFYHPGRRLLVAQDVGYPLMHEFTHALHFADLDARQVEQNIWFLEGVATLFENATISATDATDPEGPGDPVVPDDADLPPGPRPLTNSRMAMAQYLLSRDELVPWSGFLAMDAAAYMARAPEHYAQSRAMVMWMWEQGKLREFHERYCATATTDPTGAAALEQVFPGEPQDLLEARWLAWLAALPIPKADHPAGELWLGVMLRRDDDGMRVVGMRADGPAAQCGLQPDDVIREMAGQPTLSHEHLLAVLAGHRTGDTVTVAVRRGSEQLQFSLRIDARPVENTPDPLEPDVPPLPSDSGGPDADHR